MTGNKKKNNTRPQRPLLISLLLLFTAEAAFPINRHLQNNIRFTEISYNLTLTLNGGIAGFDYKQARIKQKGGMAWGADLDFSYFHNKYFGFGGGVGFSRIGNNLHLTNQQYTWENVKDIEGETYNHSVFINHLRDKVYTYYINVPIKIYGLIPVRKFGFLLTIGASPSFPVENKVKTNGDLYHIGYYPKWHLDLDVHKYGFYTSNNFSTSYIPHTSIQVFALSSLDIIFSPKQNIEFFLGAQAKIGLINFVKKKYRSDIGFINDSPQGDIYHPFMNKYRTLLETNELAKPVRPYAFELRLGIRFTHYKYRKNGYANYGKDD